MRCHSGSCMSVLLTRPLTSVTEWSTREACCGLAWFQAVLRSMLLKVGPKAPNKKVWTDTHSDRGKSYMCYVSETTGYKRVLTVWFYSFYKYMMLQRAKQIYNFLKVEQWLPGDGGDRKGYQGLFPEEWNIVCCGRTLNYRGVCICQSSEPYTWDLYIFIFVVFIWKGK